MRAAAGLMVAIMMVLAPVRAWAAEELAIDSAEALRALSRRVAAGDSLAGVTVYLTRDLGPVGFMIPIGTALAPFEGRFDGRGHVIEGVVVDGGSGCEGLFGCVGRMGSVRDVTLARCLCSGVRFTGALCGVSAGPVIRCQAALCRVEGRSGAEMSSGTGGLAGCLSADMAECRAVDAWVYGQGPAGGLVGSLYVGRISDCAFRGQIAGSPCGGGIAGSVHADCRLCFCRSEARTGPAAGGVCGRAEHALLFANWCHGDAPLPVLIPLGRTLLSGNRTLRLAPAS